MSELWLDDILDRTIMDDLDRENALVLAVFAGGLVAFVAGYLLAWRAKRTAYRRAGSLKASDRLYFLDR